MTKKVKTLSADDKNIQERLGVIAEGLVVLRESIIQRDKTQKELNSLRSKINGRIKGARRFVLKCEKEGRELDYVEQVLEQIDALKVDFLSLPHRLPHQTIETRQAFNMGRKKVERYERIQIYKW